MNKPKIAFLGTPDFVDVVRETLKNNFELVEDAAEADLLVVAAYGKILEEQELNAAKYGGINIHPSLLPKYRGPSPLQSAILNGDQVTGVTIIKMDPEVDHGPILAQQELAVNPDETFESLAKKSFELGAQMLIELIPAYIEGKIELQEQNHQQATFCDRIAKKDGFFEIDNPPSPEELNRMIRAYYPWPSAWTRWNGKVLKLFPDRKIQLEGKKVMSIGEFLRGYPTLPKTIVQSTN